MAIQTQSAVILKTIVLFVIAMTLGQLLETSAWRGDHHSDHYRPSYQHNGNQIESLKYTENVVHSSSPAHSTGAVATTFPSQSLTVHYYQQYQFLSCTQYRCWSHTVSFPVSNYSLLPAVPVPFLQTVQVLEPHRLISNF